jgi:hypothetical protein
MEKNNGFKTKIGLPNCGSTGTYNVGVAHGYAGCQYKQCKTSFRIYMNQGSVDQVK